MYTHNVEILNLFNLELQLKNTEFVICYNFGLEIKKKKKQRRNKT